MSRPTLRKVSPYTWWSKDGHGTPGLVIRSRTHPVAVHLTTAEALALANDLVDVVEAIEAEQQEAHP